MQCYSAALRKVPRYSLINLPNSLTRSFITPANSIFPTKRYNKPSLHSNTSAINPFSPLSSRRTLTIMASARPGEALCFPKASRSVKSLIDTATGTPIPIELVSKSSLEGWLSSQPSTVSSWIKTTDFKAKDDEICVIPSSSGGIERVLLGVENTSDLWSYASLPKKLPPGEYALSASTQQIGTAAALGWALGTYAYTRYKTKNSGDGAADSKVKLVWPQESDKATVTCLAEGFFLARDMITTPAEDMSPQDIAAEAVAVAAAHNAKSHVIVGDDLLTQGYPAVHTVGRASVNPPHLIDFTWTPPGSNSASSLPKVTLVGKGVSFDTGGLDLKPASAMKLMKKDMGGSALILALAHTIMSANLKVTLRVLIPAVENSVSSNAYRPLDVLQTRAGITVENGNTDAEGRLILCDALAEAVTEKPELLIDAATLTGAARVALGTELPALFSNNDAVAQEILDAAAAVNDHVWRLPLHQPYRKMLDSKVADIYSCSEGGYAGAITAALFLLEFAKDAPAWVHLDTMGYNLSTKPGRPEGGEAYALRAMFEFLSRRYKS